MKVADMQIHELMQQMADFFESEKINYWVVGSMASMAYGDPRFTNDVDIVADLKAVHVGRFCQTFGPPEYYVSEMAIRDAIKNRFQFNVLHPASGLKADVILPPFTEFSRTEALRKKRIRSEGEFDAWFASAEDVILSKLVYFQLSGGVSDKHLRDISGVIRLRGLKLDRPYITSWAGKLGIASEWEMVQKRTNEANS
jgi:hypothetical protein